jgi:hypothetical protein
MPRIPRAAKQLHTEIASVVPDATILPSEPDGFGVYRTVVYEGDGVAELLEAVSGDKRIAAVSGNVVEFSTKTNSDTSDPFGVAKAHGVLNGQKELIPGTGIPTEDDEEAEEEEPSLEDRLNSMTRKEIMAEYGFESGTKKDIIAEILSDNHE